MLFPRNFCCLLLEILTFCVFRQLNTFSATSSLPRLMRVTIRHASHHPACELLSGVRVTIQHASYYPACELLEQSKYLQLRITVPVIKLICSYIRFRLEKENGNQSRT